MILILPIDWNKASKKALLGPAFESRQSTLDLFIIILLFISNLFSK
jgi:hypothetical protein